MESEGRCVKGIFKKMDLRGRAGQNESASDFRFNHVPVSRGGIAHQQLGQKAGDEQLCAHD